MNINSGRREEIRAFFTSFLQVNVEWFYVDISLKKEGNKF